MLNRCEDGIHLPDNLQMCFFNWDKLYNGELNQKKDLRACWMKIPKVIYWCIWNERNHRILQDIAQPTWKISIKANASIGEIVSVLRIPKNKGNLTGNENDWLQSLNIYAESNLAKKQLENWEVRLDKS